MCTILISPLRELTCNVQVKMCLIVLDDVAAFSQKIFPTISQKFRLLCKVVALLRLATITCMYITLPPESVPFLPFSPSSLHPTPDSPRVSAPLPCFNYSATTWHPKNRLRELFHGLRQSHAASPTAQLRQRSITTDSLGHPFHHHGGRGI